MKKLLWALAIFLALPALAQNRRSIDRLDITEEFRPPVKTVCTSLTNQRAGDQCWDTDDKKFYIYDGSSWGITDDYRTCPTDPPVETCVTGNWCVGTTNLILYACTNGDWVPLSGGGGGGGSSTLDGLTDAAVSSPSAGHLLVYNGTNSLWQNVALSGDVTVTQAGVAAIATGAVTLTTDVTGTLPIANGGTGGTTTTAARSSLGAAASGINTDITALTGTFVSPLGAANGGTGQSSATDDSVLVGSGAAFALSAVPNCPDSGGNHLNYSTSGNSFSCGTSGGGGGGGYSTIIDEAGATLTTRTQLHIQTSGGGTALDAADDSGTPETDITLTTSPTGASAVVGTGRLVTGGTGVDVNGADSGTDLSGTITLTTDSDETGFLNDGGSTALTCSGSNQGAAQVLDAGTLNWCDGLTTTTRHAALGESDGDALSGDTADNFFLTGTLASGIGGTGTTSLGTSGECLYSAGTSIANPSSGTCTYTDGSGGGTLTIGTLTTFGAADASRGLTFQDNTTEMSAPSVTSPTTTVLYSLRTGGNSFFYVKDDSDGTTERLLLDDAAVTGDITFTNAGVSSIGADKVTEADLKAVDAASDEECLTYETTTGDFEWQTCASGTGDITAVGPGYADGAAFTDEKASTGTTMFIWEGTSLGANEFSIEAPSADPGSDIVATFPATTTTLIGRDTTDTLTNKTYDAGGTGNVFTIEDGTGVSTSGSGQLKLDTSADQLIYQGSAAKVLDPRQTLSVVVLSPATTDDPFIFKAPYGMTITDIDCIVGAATNTVIQVEECDATGASCTDVDATDITCDTDGAADDGSLSNASIDANDWVHLDIVSVSGTPGQVSVTIIYSVVQQ
jgi:hypothetical protein